MESNLTKEEAIQFALPWKKFRSEYDVCKSARPDLTTRQAYKEHIEFVQEVLELDILAPLEVPL